MVKAIIYFTLLALSASSVLAVPEGYGRREVSEDELLAREDYAPTMFSREDTANLQEREPFLGAIFGIAARIGGRIAAKVGSKAARHVVRNKVNNHRRRRDLEPEDEVDFAAREDLDELVDRELDMFEREINEDDILGREVDEDLYLD